jgi:methionyl-tRNA formyltransferase
MKITLFCSDPNHPVNTYLKRWTEAQANVHEVALVHETSQLVGGDFLFLISCTEIISASVRERYKNTLVLHASDLPRGRGWSPHIWELVQGAEHITLSLLEADDKVDNGRIWLKKKIGIPKHALWYEINHLLFTAEVQLIDDAVQNFNQIRPVAQPPLEQTTYYRKRTPQDSKIDPRNIDCGAI